MINYELPTSVAIDDIEYKINKKCDYRMILDVISALNDDELTNEQKAIVSLNIFYNFNVPDNTNEALEKNV
jgi:Bacteriophage Gp15 protein.